MYVAYKRQNGKSVKVYLNVTGKQLNRQIENKNHDHLSILYGRVYSTTNSDGTNTPNDGEVAGWKKGFVRIFIDIHVYIYIYIVRR